MIKEKAGELAVTKREQYLTGHMASTVLFMLCVALAEATLALRLPDRSDLFKFHANRNSVADISKY